MFIADSRITYMEGQVNNKQWSNRHVVPKPCAMKPARVEHNNNATELGASPGQDTHVRSQEPHGADDDTCATFVRSSGC